MALGGFDEGQTRDADNPFFSSEQKYDFWSDAHCLAAEQLDFALNSDAPLTLFIGPEGSGKTTVIRKVASETNSKRLIGTLSHYSILESTPRAAIFRALGASAPRSNTDLDKTTFDATMTRANMQHGLPALVIDDADNVQASTLQRLFDICATTQEGLLVKLVLVGREDFDDKLNPEIRSLYSPVVKLGLMSEEDTSDYVHHRCAVAGFKTMPFTPKALKELYLVSQGNPLILNVACMVALDEARRKRQPIIDSDQIKRCCAKEGIRANTFVFASSRSAKK